MLCHYLTPHNIVPLNNVRSKGDALVSLVEALCKVNNFKNVKYLTDAIMDREKESSTFLPTGIAIPHARVADVPEITLVMGVSKDGIREAPESDPTHLFFLFFSPIKEKEFGKHLKLLSKIAAIFREPSFVKEVANAPDADRIFAIVQHKERETAPD
jgi:mannitol/fructose-specific phosphotransferase system IIA component (Ntr-type)